MADATPPTPKAAAKGVAGLFKNKPAWVWIAGVTVLLGAAYLAFRRGQAPADAMPDETTAEDPYAADVMAEGDYGGYYPVATQGAYGGYDVPPDYAPPATADTPDGPATVVNVTYPAPVTGGGKPAATGVATHSAPPKPDKLYAGHTLSWWKARRKKVKGKWRYAWPPHPNTYTHTRAYAGH